jgi:hypothetical protein
MNDSAFLRKNASSSKVKFQGRELGDVKAERPEGFLAE